MDQNFQNFISYLNKNEIKHESNSESMLIRFGYNIEVGTIEIVTDFEHENRIGFFSFLNMNVAEHRKAEALILVNLFNESLNYGSIVISQTNHLVYKIMVSTFGNMLSEENWSEIIFRLWSISRDIYPLFGRLIFSNEDANILFESFLKGKEKQYRASKNHLEEGDSPEIDQDTHKPPFWKDNKGWYMQN